jgi:protocatechuate 3,4-dioxygenase beta subunit
VLNRDRLPGAVDRRTMLLGGAAAALIAACGDGDDTDGVAPTSSATDASTTTASGAASSTAAPVADAPLTAADFERLGTCTLLPEQMAGPFPLEEQLVRRDITEGSPGHPLRLGLRVVDASCAPVPGAAVEIWHCDATGDYSAFADGGGGKDDGPGTTFCRGTQVADGDGIVELLTIYPGWYRGRAVHIHVRVHVEATTVLTSQLYFDDAYTSDVYRDDPYAEFGEPDTPTARDMIAGDPADDGTLLVTRRAETAHGPGTLGLLNLGVAR